MDASVFCGHWKGRTYLPEQKSSYDAARDEFKNSYGCTFRQLPQEFPALAPLYSSFELHFNSLPFVNWAAATYHVAFGVCAAYLLFVAVGEWSRRRAAAADKRAWEAALGPEAKGGPPYPGYFGKPWAALYVAPAAPYAGVALPAPARRALVSAPKLLLSAWNLLLAVFSLIGFARTMPHLIFYGARHGFYASVCAPAEAAFGQGATGFWVMLFIFSKVPELVDTIFLVAARKPVIFLHWYHHFTVLLYCWHSYGTRSSIGLYFAAMNYGVHAVMYFYFFLTARGYRPKWDSIVTTLQISQMFVGMGICAAVYYFQSVQKLHCDVTDENYIAGLVMYGSYAVLFILFALKRFAAPAKKKSAGAKKTA